MHVPVDPHPINAQALLEPRGRHQETSNSLATSYKTLLTEPNQLMSLL